MVEASVPELKGQVSFECGSWDGPLTTSLVTMWELMKPSWCPHPITDLIWDMTADVAYDLDDDARMHDLAMIHHLLATELPDQNQPVSVVVKIAMLAVRWLESNAGTSERGTTVPRREQLSSVKINHNLDLFSTSCRVLRKPKSIERTWARRHMSRNTEADQSFQLNVGPGT